ncbi:PP2C family protein-serine/threonine phosphatase [Symbioplanes lichenis]|uniref:PP2C family protein-serine/threonine phosphatase n=1 Tax=Symbioplanes lichenis TaxID=1629072 RepID=UPI00273A3FEA|nr:PP2C family serine/threonine-protein phosphatase [Actinoplanes lichenis]
MAIDTAQWQVGARRVVAAAGSIVGNRYRENYDVLHLDAARPLAVVADGMGDGPGSTAAGRTAVDTFVATLSPPPGGSDPTSAGADPDGAATLLAAVAHVQQAVLAAGRDLPGHLTGCTLTAFVAGPSVAWLVHLGDSRAYRLRDNLLEQLTTDHTMAWIGVQNGWFTPDSPQGHRARYQLTRYAGHSRAPEPDILAATLRPGDTYLLCTDGIADQVPYERLAELLTEDPAPATEALLAATLPTGADNATAVVIRVF